MYRGQRINKTLAGLLRQSAALLVLVSMSMAVKAESTLANPTTNQAPIVPAASAHWPATVGGAGIGQMLLSLIFVVAVIVALAYALRQMQGVGRGSRGRLKFIDALAVGAKERVVLIEVGKTQLLVGVATGAVQILHVLSEDQRIIQDDGGKIGQNLSVEFRDRLAAVMGKAP